MICAKFDNRDLHFNGNDIVSKALDFAADFDLSTPDGRHEIDGDNIFAMTAAYNTKDANDLKFEAHKKYIDIQLLLGGREFLDVSLDGQLDIDTPYSDENDAMLFGPPNRFTSVLLEPGNFVVLYPDDIHRPGRMIEEPKKVRKMVIKVRIQEV